MLVDGSKKRQGRVLPLIGEAQQDLPTVYRRPASADHLFGIELIEQPGQVSRGDARLGAQVATARLVTQPSCGAVMSHQPTLS